MPFLPGMRQMAENGPVRHTEGMARYRGRRLEADSGTKKLASVEHAGMAMTDTRGVPVLCRIRQPGGAALLPDSAVPAGRYV